MRSWTNRPDAPPSTLGLWWGQSRPKRESLANNPKGEAASIHLGLQVLSMIQKFKHTAQINITLLIFIRNLLFKLICSGVT